MYATHYSNFHRENFLICGMSSTVTVESYLSQWLEQKKFSVQESTYRNYSSVLQPLQSMFSTVRLLDLTEEQVQNVVDFLEGEGRNSMAYHMIQVLKGALEPAVVRGLIAVNPARGVKLKPFLKEESAVLSLAQQRVFWQAIKGEQLEYLFQFLLLTGARIGEATALCWSDIDFEKSTVYFTKSVRREKAGDGASKLMLVPTKTKCSNKRNLGPWALNVLTCQKEQQERQFGYVRENDLVFSTRKKTFVENSAVNRTLKRVRKRMCAFDEELHSDEHELNDLPQFTVHSLRHTFATRALETKIPLKVVSGWLGHSTVRVTGDIYSHVLPELQRVSILQLEQYLNEVLAISSEDEEDENF